jgi:hypothetical protein
MFVANRRIASRSDNLSSACKTIVVAITSAGTDGRPRRVGNNLREQLVREQAGPVLGQEPVHRPLRQEMNLTTPPRPTAPDPTETSPATVL